MREAGEGALASLSLSAARTRLRASRQQNDEEEAAATVDLLSLRSSAVTPPSAIKIGHLLLTPARIN